MPRAYYRDYLSLPEVLSSQHPLGSHRDEMLFIIAHQSHELWFKQILHELKAVQDLFRAPSLSSQALYHSIALFERITQIQKALGPLINITATIHPMSFLAFRDYLAPASGLQSAQFQEIEHRLKKRDLTSFFQHSNFDEKDQKALEEAAKTPCLFSLVETWLERMPFAHTNTFNFWTLFSQTIDKTLAKEEESINEHFEMILKEDLYPKSGRALSREASLNALFIFLYHNTPLLNPASHFLSLLVDVDDEISSWKFKHSLMVQRMIGSKMGTGGSSGVEYLRSSLEKGKAFVDLTNLSSFLLPEELLPPLPKEIEQQLSYKFGE